MYMYVCVYMYMHSKAVIKCAQAHTEAEIGNVDSEIRRLQVGCICICMYMYVYVCMYVHCKVDTL